MEHGSTPTPLQARAAFPFHVLEINYLTVAVWRATRQQCTSAGVSLYRTRLSNGLNLLPCRRPVLSLVCSDRLTPLKCEKNASFIGESLCSDMTTDEETSPRVSCNREVLGQRRPFLRTTQKRHFFHPSSENKVHAQHGPPCPSSSPGKLSLFRPALYPNVPAVSRACRKIVSDSLVYDTHRRSHCRSQSGDGRQRGTSRHVWKRRR